MISWEDLKAFRESEVRVEYTTRNGQYLTHTGTVESVGMKYMHLEPLTGSGNVYRIPIPGIRSIKDLNSGTTVHNFSKDGRRGGLNLSQEVIE